MMQQRMMLNFVQIHQMMQLMMPMKIEDYHYLKLLFLHHHWKNVFVVLLNYCFHHHLQEMDVYILIDFVYLEQMCIFHASYRVELYYRKQVL